MMQSRATYSLQEMQRGGLDRNPRATATVCGILAVSAPFYGLQYSCLPKELLVQSVDVICSPGRSPGTGPDQRAQGGSPDASLGFFLESGHSTVW